MSRWPCLVSLVALVACPADAVNDPSPTPSPAPQIADAPPVAATKASPPAASAAPVAAVRPWWCLCYYSMLEEGPAPRTECRHERGQCQEIADRLAKWTQDDAIEGSMTHPCQQVAGEHPGDGPGGRADWTAAKSGGWQRPGACTLPGPGLREGRAAVGYVDLLDEQIGEITWAMSAETEARALLGKPKRGPRELLPDDISIEAWTYPKQGLELRVVGPGELSVLGIHIKAPSPLKTRKGVHIGSTRAEVRAAYGDMLDPAEVTDHDAEWTVGYDRMLTFKFTGDTVVGISLTGGWD